MSLLKLNTSETFNLVNGIYGDPKWFRGPVATFLHMPDFRMGYVDQDADGKEICSIAPLSSDLSLWQQPEHCPSRLEKYLPKGTVHVDNDAHLAAVSTESFSNKRVAIVAWWSESGKIAPYVLYYLRALKTEGWHLILACGREPQFPASLSHLCDAVVWRSCPGYDFTSWKCCFELFPSLFKAQEILLTNDSIFAPIFPLAPVHQAMQKVDCDFWGMVGSRELITHLQSYYLVFRPAAIQHSAFHTFWEASPLSSNRKDAIYQEVSLTGWLVWNGLKAGVYVPPEALLQIRCNPAYCFCRQLLACYQVPCIKRNLLLKYRNESFMQCWDKIVQSGGYNLQLIRAELSESPLHKETREKAEF